MDLEKLFYGQVEKISRFDSVSIKVAEYAAPEGSRSESEFNAQKLGALSSIFELHDGIHLEWSGLRQGQEIHGSLNFCSRRVALGRIRDGDYWDDAALDRNPSYPKIAPWVELEEVFGRSDIVIAGGTLFEQLYWLDGTHLKRWLPTPAACLIALVETVGHDGTRPILARNNWQQGTKDIIMSLSTLD